MCARCACVSQNLQEWFESLQTLHDRAMFCLTHKAQDRYAGEHADGIPRTGSTSTLAPAPLAHTLSRAFSSGPAPTPTSPPRILSPGRQMTVSSPAAPTTVGPHGVVLYTHQGTDLVHLTRSDPPNVQPPLMVSANADGSLWIEVVTLAMLPTLRQKGSIIHLTMKDRSQDTQVVYVYPALKEAEVRIVIPPHLQRGSVLEADGRVKILLTNVAEEIILLAPKNKV